jgi:hypothetical protein
LVNPVPFPDGQGFQENSPRKLHFIPFLKGAALKWYRVKEERPYGNEKNADEEKSTGEEKGAGKEKGREEGKRTDKIYWSGH